MQCQKAIPSYKHVVIYGTHYNECFEQLLHITKNCRLKIVVSFLSAHMIFFLTNPCPLSLKSLFALSL